MKLSDELEYIFSQLDIAPEKFDWTRHRFDKAIKHAEILDKLLEAMMEKQAEIDQEIDSQKQNPSSLDGYE